MKQFSKHLPAEERRAVIINAVIGLAAEQNPCRITTAAIAERMNLTQGALFRHFSGKDAIWKAVMEWVAEQLLTKVERAAQDATSPLAALEAMFMANIDFVAAHPGVPRMLFGELQRKEDTAAKLIVRIFLRKYGKRLKELLEAGKTLGELRSELDVSSAAVTFLGTIQGLVAQSLLTDEIQSMRDEAPKVFALYRYGIAVAP